MAIQNICAVLPLLFVVPVVKISHALPLAPQDTQLCFSSLILLGSCLNPGTTSSPVRLTEPKNQARVCTCTSSSCRGGQNSKRTHVRSVRAPATLPLTLSPRSEPHEEREPGPIFPLLEARSQPDTSKRHLAETAFPDHGTMETSLRDSAF